MKDWFKKYWLHVLITTILIVIIVKVVKSTSQSKGGGGNLTSDGGFNPSSSLDLNKPLSLGSVGAEVGELQRMINNAYMLMGSSSKIIIVDDSFGNQTATALNELLGKSEITLSEASSEYQSIFGGTTSGKPCNFWWDPLCALGLKN